MFKGAKLIKTFRIAAGSDIKSTKLQLKESLGSCVHKVDSIIICSVVPKKTAELQRLLKKLLGLKAKIIGKDIRVPIRNLYKRPQQVGKDRLFNAYACKCFYGAPAVIVDFGTATTCDYINKRSGYEGGIIAPGVEISLEVLYQKTALLPKVKIKKSTTFLGTSTADSINSGALYELVYMCDGFISSFKQRFGKKIRIVATGGLVPFFKKRCKHIDIVDRT